MSSNKYVNLSLYFTLPPEKSPTEAIAAVNRFIKEKLSMEYELLACENWNKKHPEVVRISNVTAEIHDMDTAALELDYTWFEQLDNSKKREFTHIPLLIYGLSLPQGDHRPAPDCRRCEGRSRFQAQCLRQ